MKNRNILPLAVALLLAVAALAATMRSSDAGTAREAATKPAIRPAAEASGSAARNPVARRPTVLCTRYAAPTGSDSNRGTKARPFKTAQRLADSLRPGQTGCLRGGIYDERENDYILRVDRGGTRHERVTIRSFPGERARLVGVVSVVNEAPYVKLAGLAIEGLGGQNTVKIYAEGVVIEDADITNASRGESCMILGSSSDHGRAIGTVVRRSRFRDCGSPDNDNKDHAIYVSNAVDVYIVGNVFWNTAGYSIHLYPNARGTRILHNVIDGAAPSTRGGVLFGGNSDYASSGNVVAFNVIAFSETYNITSNWDDGLIGDGNVARRNCVWEGEEGNVDASDGGFTAYANRAAPPQFVNRERRDYRLRRTSKCRAVVGYDAAARLRRP